MIQEIVTRQVENILQKVLTKVVDESARKKAQEMAENTGTSLNSNFHCVVSGYYVAILFQYLMIPLAMLLLVVGIVDGRTEELSMRIVLIGSALLFLSLVVLARTHMFMLIYWDDGMLLMDRKGNTMAQIPSSAWNEVIIVKKSQIIMPWNGKKYVIVRNPKDNEQAVREMIAFYEERNI